LIETVRVPIAPDQEGKEMSKFCQNCGAPLEGVFCVKCGTKAGEAASPQQAQPSMQPPPYAPPSVQGMQPAAAPPKKGSNTVLKIVFIVLGILLLLGVLAGVGLYWAASKVKDKVEQVAAQSGVDLKELARSGQSASHSEGGDGCWLLPREDAERITGFKIIRASEKANGDSGKLTCQYFADQNEIRETAQAQADAAMKALKSSKGDNSASDLQQLEKFTKGMIAGTVQSKTSDGALFEIAVRRTGGQSDWAGVSMAKGLMGGMEKVEGLGDHALIAPMGVALFVLHGDSFVEITMSGLPGGRDKGIEIARAILDRL